MIDDDVIVTSESQGGLFLTGDNLRDAEKTEPVLARDDGTLGTFMERYLAVR